MLSVIYLFRLYSNRWLRGGRVSDVDATTKFCNAGLELVADGGLLEKRLQQWVGQQNYGLECGCKMYNKATNPHRLTSDGQKKSKKEEDTDWASRGMRTLEGRCDHGS